MKKYIKLAVIYVFIAVVAVFVYADFPWTLHLRPWDPSILKAGMSIISGVALAGVFGTSTYFMLKDPDVKLLEPSKILDDDEVIPVLQEYEETPFVGDLAGDALEQIRSASRKQGRLHKAIDAQFAPGSLSWDRFTNLVDTAQRTILRNASLVANHVQSFDREGYDRVRRTKRDATSSGLHSEQLALYDQTLTEAREIITANERVLLEMGKLELELSRLDANEQMEENSQTVTELQTLIDETRYYQ